MMMVMPVEHPALGRFFLQLEEAVGIRVLLERDRQSAGELVALVLVGI